MVTGWVEWVQGLGANNCGNTLTPSSFVLTVQAIAFQSLRYHKLLWQVEEEQGEQCDLCQEISQYHHNEDGGTGNPNPQWHTAPVPEEVDGSNVQCVEHCHGSPDGHKNKEEVSSSHGMWFLQVKGKGFA